MRVLDMETILICAVMAVIGTFGVIAGGVAFAGRTFWDCNPTVLVGLGCGMSGLLWGILLVSAGNRKSKRI